MLVPSRGVNLGLERLQLGVEQALPREGSGSKSPLAAGRGSLCAARARRLVTRCQQQIALALLYCSLRPPRRLPQVHDLASQLPDPLLVGPRLTLEPPHLVINQHISKLIVNYGGKGETRCASSTSLAVSFDDCFILSNTLSFWLESASEGASLDGIALQPRVIDGPRYQALP